MSQYQTNVEFVSELMEFSRYGALAQAFMIEALHRYAGEVAAADPRAFDSAGLSGNAWVGVAKEILAKTDGKYGQRRAPVAMTAISLQERGEVQEPMSTRAGHNLSSVDDCALFAEIKRRGSLVLIWSADDFDPVLDDDDEVLALEMTEEERAGVQRQAFEQASRDLDDIVTARGNEHLSDWWAQNKEPILLKIKEKTVADSPISGM